MKEKTGVKASLDDDIRQFRWLHPFLYDVHLDAIDRNLLDQITNAKLATGVSHATVNRVLELIRALLRCAEREWEWLDKAPFIRMLPEPKKRIRWLTIEEAKTLLAELPEHLAMMVRFSLATGLREANVVKLQWSQVDLGRCCAWIHPDQAKARKAIPVPLNADAMQVLKEVRGQHTEFVFTYNNKPVLKANNTAWRNTLKRLGINNFRWHDLRHTWASWHIQQGTPMHVLQELGGWAGPEMVQRYAHLSLEHLREYANNLQGIAA